MSFLHGLEDDWKLSVTSQNPTVRLRSAKKLNETVARSDRAGHRKTDSYT